MATSAADRDVDPVWFVGELAVVIEELRRLAHEIG